MFDRFVSGRRPSWKRRALLIGSLVMHAVVALALVVSSWFHVAELTPPMLAVVFLSAPNPPPPPAPPGRATATERRVKSPHPQLTAPTPTPPTATTADPTPPGSGPPGSDGPPDAPPGGDPHSPTTSCSGGNCNGPAAPAPHPRNLPPHALDAQRIGGVMPHLPASVLGTRRGLGDSTFTARLCVDQSGAISSVTVLSGIPGADGDIVATLRGWRYKPQAIPVCFITQLVYDVQ